MAASMLAVDGIQLPTDAAPEIKLQAIINALMSHGLISHPLMSDGITRDISNIALPTTMTVDRSLGNLSGRVDALEGINIESKIKEIQDALTVADGFVKKMEKESEEYKNFAKSTLQDAQALKLQQDVVQKRAK